jgi:hypothetical protein
MPLFAGQEACALDDGCCGECFAKCFAALRCAKIGDDPFWAWLEASLAKIGSWAPKRKG